MIAPTLRLPDRVRTVPLLAWLAGLVAGAFVLSVCVGPGIIGFGGDAAARGLILTEIRLPRALLGAFVGAALGLSGAALQGYLRNPLAEPGVIGVSGGAALGAVLAIHLGIAAAFPLALPVAGLCRGDTDDFTRRCFGRGRHRSHSTDARRRRGVSRHQRVDCVSLDHFGQPICGRRKRRVDDGLAG